MTKKAFKFSKLEGLRTQRFFAGAFAGAGARTGTRSTTVSRGLRFASLIFTKVPSTALRARGVVFIQGLSGQCHSKPANSQKPGYASKLGGDEQLLIFAHTGPVTVWAIGQGCTLGLFVCQAACSSPSGEFLRHAMSSVKSIGITMGSSCSLTLFQ